MTSLIRTLFLSTVLLRAIPFLIMWDVWLMLIQRAVGITRHYSIWIALALNIASITIFFCSRFGLNAFLPERFSSDVLPPKVLSYSFEIVFSFSSLCEAVMISSAVLFTAASCLLAKILTCILLMPYVCISFIFICIYVHFSM